MRSTDYGYAAMTGPRRTSPACRAILPSFLLPLFAAGCVAHSSGRPGSACPADAARIAEAAQWNAFDGSMPPREFFRRRYSKAAVIAGDDGKIHDVEGMADSAERQLRDNDTQSGGAPGEVSVRFADGLALLTFVSRMHNIDRATGAVQDGTFRESRVFACEDGEWKVIFRAEVQRPNAGREPVWSERAKFQDYVGTYRMVHDGRLLGNVTVKLEGDRLLEAWGDQPAEELLPGGHDTFFVRDDGTVEQFLRDALQRVVGIHYIFWDDHYEAQRVD